MKSLIDLGFISISVTDSSKQSTSSASVDGVPDKENTSPPALFSSDLRSLGFIFPVSTTQDNDSRRPNLADSNFIVHKEVSYDDIPVGNSIIPNNAPGMSFDVVLPPISLIDMNAVFKENFYEDAFRDHIEGVPNCLFGEVFLLSGSGRKLDEGALRCLIISFGGTVTTAFSQNVNYVVAGDAFGIFNEKRAEAYGIAVIDEDIVFTLIRSSPLGSNMSPESGSRSCEIGSVISTSPQISPNRDNDGKRNEQKINADISKTDSNAGSNNKLASAHISSSARSVDSGSEEPPYLIGNLEDDTVVINQPYRPASPTLGSSSNSAYVNEGTRSPINSVSVDKAEASDVSVLGNCTATHSRNFVSLEDDTIVLKQSLRLASPTPGATSDSASVKEDPRFQNATASIEKAEGSDVYGPKNYHSTDSRNLVCLDEDTVVFEQSPRPTSPTLNDDLRSPVSLESNEKAEGSEAPGLENCAAIDSTTTHASPALADISNVSAAAPCTSSLPENKMLNHPWHSIGLARNPGSRIIPQGKRKCLAGFTFVLTGDGDSMNRPQLTSLITSHGGTVSSFLSLSTHYLVAGLNPGKCKLEKAKRLKVSIIDEAALFHLIRSSPSFSERFDADNSFHSNSSMQLEAPPKSCDPDHHAVLYVDKYKPTRIKDIIGQNHSSSNAAKLLAWLKNWKSSLEEGTKNRGKSKFQPVVSGNHLRGALLLGPPGIGKTSTAHVVAAEAGFHVIEFNASSMNDQYILIMDEVDGICGCEDRGGLAEFTSLVKLTDIPIIAIANNCSAPKFKSLRSYMYELHFPALNSTQIFGRLRKITYVEKLSIPDECLRAIILRCQFDVRQCINTINMLAWDNKDSQPVSESMFHASLKDKKPHLFEASTRYLEGNIFNATDSLDDKLAEMDRLYDCYPDLMLNMVFENYGRVVPEQRFSNQEKLSLAANSLSSCDIMETLMTKRHRYDLRDTLSTLSRLPGCYIDGSIDRSLMKFPSALKNSSSYMKNGRTATLLSSHARSSWYYSRSDIACYFGPSFKDLYCQFLLNASTKLLTVDEAVKNIAQLMNGHSLAKSDIDNVIELTRWPNKKHPLCDLPRAIKTAATKKLNSSLVLTPFSLAQADDSKEVDLSDSSDHCGPSKDGKSTVSSFTNTQSNPQKKKTC
ncbi:Oidioi.mRNA.OKI2018_I69.chr2.g7159.t1.cds [Oikopleura dioica]|uniref:Oidioi.mRNA.OKI2018_I69.chr2.g7159.t1.cds n=1 Tax=Oikopleura dioica TaxID=34765 RepID=A0ABN7TBU6_OIKDI|nr:Oidioi.mRNA.OKI2018_I69.chr2.g7159.t1.cds [Oikopleura dioica]